MTAVLFIPMRIALELFPCQHFLSFDFVCLFFGVVCNGSHSDWGAIGFKCSFKFTTLMSMGKESGSWQEVQLCIVMLQKVQYEDCHVCS